MLSLFRAGRLAALASLVLAATPAATPAGAQDVTAGDLLIQRPWTRATPGGAEVAGGYLTILNRGTTADTLTGGTFAAASGFEVHDMGTANGVMTMRPTGPLPIPPGGAVTLSPSGMHAMFTGLKRPLRKGEAVEGTLVFARAGTVPLRYSVEGIGARAPSENRVVAEAVDGITVTDPMSRATPAGAPTGVGYMTISNAGAVPDLLVGASCPAADHVEIHEMAVKDGVMLMRPVPGGLPVPAHGSVTLKPGGYHLMLIKPKAPLVAGTTVPVTLMFKGAGAKTVDLKVEPLGGASKP